MCCSGNARDNLFRSPIRSKMKAIQSMSMKIALQCSRCKRVFARQNFFSGICNFSASGVSIHLRHMKCTELLALLNEYVDGTVDPSICEEFEKHMAGCNPCQVVVDNIRKTITLYREGKAVELPVEFQNRLHAVLRRRWEETQKKDTHA